MILFPIMLSERLKRIATTTSILMLLVIAVSSRAQAQTHQYNVYLPLLSNCKNASFLLPETVPYGLNCFNLSSRQDLFVLANNTGALMAIHLDMSTLSKTYVYISDPMPTDHFGDFIDIAEPSVSRIHYEKMNHPYLGSGAIRRSGWIGRYSPPAEPFPGLNQEILSTEKFTYELAVQQSEQGLNMPPEESMRLLESLLAEK